MPQSDAIDEFIALPREQQLSTLQSLSPEKQDKLLGQVKQRRSAPKGPAPKADTPEARTAGNYASEVARGVGRGIKNDVVGMYDAVRHPDATIQAGSEQAKAGDAAGEKEFRDTKGAPLAQRAGAYLMTELENAPIIGGMVQHAEQGGTRPGSPESVGAAAEGVTTFEAPAVALHGVKALAPRLRPSAQSLVGAGEKNVKPIVAKEAASAGEAAKSAIKSNREAAANNATDTAAVKSGNKEAVRAQGKIAPTEEKLKTTGRELQGQIETARNNALKVGNEKYNTVNEALSGFTADGEQVVGAVESAAGKISGSNTRPPILKDMTDRLYRGDTLDYGDLQGYYSELGKELSKGTLPGDIYTAYDTLHEAVGGEMQRIADSQGMGAQLTGARNYWRRMKQTFGKPYNPTDTGNAVLEKTTGQGTADEQANRVRLLGSFDPSIPQTVEHIDNLRKGLKSLPDQKPLRDVVKPLPAKPEMKQIHPVDVNTRAIREQLLDRWSSGESQLSKFQVRSLVGGGLGALVGGLFEGKIGAGLGGVIGSTMGPAAISRLVEVPAVREWLTRPPAGELETLRKLPSADRLRITDTLKGVVEQSAKMGKPIRVSPAATAIIVGTQGLAPRLPEQNATDAWAGVQP